MTGYQIALVVALCLVLGCSSGSSGGPGDAGGTPDLDATTDQIDGLGDPADGPSEIEAGGPDLGPADTQADVGEPDFKAPYDCLVSLECPRAMVAAHRGLHTVAPENSVAALRAAAEVGVAQAGIPGLLIVEFASAGADADFNAYAHERGVKVQQDVMAAGDSLALLGFASGWQVFLDAGVDLLQSDYPDGLIPLLDTYYETGALPDPTP